MDNKNEPKKQEKKVMLLTQIACLLKEIILINNENEPELKKESIFNMDDLPIARLDNTENEINDILDLNKSMKNEMDKKFLMMMIWMTIIIKKIW